MRRTILSGNTMIEWQATNKLPHGGYKTPLGWLWLIYSPPVKFGQASAKHVLLRCGELSIREDFIFICFLDY